MFPRLYVFATQEVRENPSKTPELFYANSDALAKEEGTRRAGGKPFTVERVPTKHV
jgi:hypothetical protein